MALIVPDVDEAIASFRRIMDWDSRTMIYERDHEDVDRESGAVSRSHVAMLPIGDCWLELIEPLSEGPLRKFLERTGGGIHHVGFMSDDIQSEWDRHARSRDDVGLIGREPLVNDRGVSFWFLHPRNNAGALVEIDSDWRRTSASDMTPIEPTPDWSGLPADRQPSG